MFDQSVAGVHDAAAGFSGKENPMSTLAKAKLLFAVAAFLSFVLSVFLWFSGQREQGLFVGLWVPSILSLGALLVAGRR